jgi:heptosyltransferase-1
VRNFTPWRRLAVKKILLVKTSSLGDVVHNFPVVRDVRARFPAARIDWMVEEAYAPLVRMHPGVDDVIPVAVRRWRRRLLRASTWSELAQWRERLRAGTYDAVIDTQGLVKSAVLARVSRGVRHGYDAATAREPFAARFYDVTHHVERGQHAVVRNRVLAGAALGYVPGEAADYGFPAQSLEPTREVVLLHSTSRADKQWPEADWIELGRELESRGYTAVLPWGSAAERSRSERLAGSLAHATVPTALGFDELSALFLRSGAVIGVDTGLVHLAAALGKPVVAIYRTTDPRLTGTYGARRARNLGAPGKRVSPEDVLQALDACGVR